MRRNVPSPQREINDLEPPACFYYALKSVNLTVPFHVMHYAGEAEDWAIATHELFELKRLIEVMQRVDPEKGAMVNGFLLGNFNKLDAAIEHENVESFDKALVETVENCNTCHAAAGSPFMKVSLDVRDGLSMRHPHDLNKSTKSGKRTHMH